MKPKRVNEKIKFHKLHEYITRNTTVSRFCMATGIYKMSLYRLLYRTHVPRLSTCQRIVELTAGYITYDDLLDKTQFEVDVVDILRIL